MFLFPQMWRIFRVPHYQPLIKSNVKEMLNEILPVLKFLAKFLLTSVELKFCFLGNDLKMIIVIICYLIAFVISS